MASRRGMALAVTIGVVSLIAILAVATLSLATRLVQDSALGSRDAALDGAVAGGLAAPMQDWRSRGIGRLAVGAAVSFPFTVAGVRASGTTWVTRVGPELFWVAAEAAAAGGAVRREHLLLRRRMPDPQALLAEDSTNVASLGFLAVDSIAASADVVAARGSTLVPGDGVVHVTGSATIGGGRGVGILIVDGMLTIAGPLEYNGIVVASGGIMVTASGVILNGLVRAPAPPAGTGSLGYSRSAAATQDVMAQSLRPVAVAGRRWAELY